MSNTAISANGEILTAYIREAALVACLGDDSHGQMRSILIEAARDVAKAPSRPGRKVILSSQQMLPSPAVTLLKQRRKKPSTTALVALTAMRDIEQALKGCGLDGLARRNELSSSFVAEAMAEQIRELAATPGVQTIRPNRRHRSIRAVAA